MVLFGEDEEEEVAAVGSLCGCGKTPESDHNESSVALGVATK